MSRQLMAVQLDPLNLAQCLCGEITLPTEGATDDRNFLVAEVVRLQNSPRKLNFHEFSYQLLHSLSESGRIG